MKQWTYLPFTSLLGNHDNASNHYKYAINVAFGRKQYASQDIPQ